jgi:hypothetical protein
MNFTKFLKHSNPGNVTLTSFYKSGDLLAFRTPFQCFVNDRRLPDPYQRSHCAGISSNPLQTRTDRTPRRLGPDCRVDGKEVPSCSSETSPRKHEKCGTVPCPVAG